MVIDGHFDFGMDILQRRMNGETDVFRRVYRDPMKRGGVDGFVCAIFVEPRYLPEMGLRNALSQISFVHEELRESCGELVLCKTAGDAERAASAGSTGIFLSLEGAEPIGSDISLLRVFYELGVRAVGITWSRRNAAADGCHFSPLEEGTKGGLTPFGVKLVRAMERLGMVIDVSHMNDEGLSDVLRFTDSPIVASHSNCRDLHHHMRNITDEQIRQIAKRGGVIGMNCCSSFVGGVCDVGALVCHMERVADTAGSAHVALGLDLCDDIYAYSSSNTPNMSDSHDTLGGYEQVPAIWDELRGRGWSDTDIKGVMGENLMRVYRKVAG